MPRPRSPDGRRHNICAKLNYAELAAVTAARGNTGLSELVRAAVLDAARVPGRKPLPTDAITITADDRMQQPGTGAFVSRGKVSAFNVGTEPGCTHPKASVIKGRCSRCRTFVGFD